MPMGEIEHLLGGGLVVSTIGELDGSYTGTLLGSGATDTVSSFSCNSCLPQFSIFCSEFYGGKGKL